MKLRIADLDYFRIQNKIKRQSMNREQKITTQNNIQNSHPALQYNSILS